MKAFSGAVAEHYDRNILKVLPGYKLAHDVTAAYLLAALPKDATILIVGAGTCKEVEVLGGLNPEWTFIAQDLSSDMLMIAKEKLPQDLCARTTFHHGPVSEMPAAQADVALALFVIHFVEDPKEKEQLLLETKKRLKPGGELLIADLTDSQIPQSFQVLAKFYEINGMSPGGVERTIDNLQTNFYPISEKELRGLLARCDLTIVSTYFQALGFVGYLIDSSAVSSSL